jgi:hypothetical protein
MRSSSTSFRALGTLLLLVGIAAAQAPTQDSVTPNQPVSTRVLPLNRFPDSRSTNTDPKGFYHMPTGIGDDYFDGTDSVARIRRHMQVARDLGVKYLRCAFSWNGIEHEQGVYNWRFWDRLLDEAERFNIQLIPYVAYTPEWAARSRVEYWKQPPRSPELFANFMAKIVAHYRGRIKSWELWNEPDLREYWQGTPQEFAELIRRGAVAVRRADPNAVIVLGGMSLGPTPFFIQLIKDEHLASYVDVIAQHGYPESWHSQRAETIFLDWTNDMRQLIEQTHTGVDFWLNEIGYPDYRFKPTNASKYGRTDVFYNYEHTLRYQGVFLFKSFVMALASSRASVTVWYRIDDFPTTERRLGDDLIHFHLGVVNARGQPKPDYRAFQFFNKLFNSPTRTVADSSSNSRKSLAVMNVLERKDGHVVIAAWLRSSESNEVRNNTGVLGDQRAETASIGLPCQRVPEIDYFNSFGEPVQSQARLEKNAGATTLTNVALRGDSVFVAVAKCLK